MYLLHKMRVGGRSGFRLGLLIMLVAWLSLGISDGAGALGVAAQASPGHGTVYLTRAEDAPSGAIVKILDLQLGLFTDVVAGLNDPSIVLCGPDGRLYVVDYAPDYAYSRIQRFNSDGSRRTLVFQRVDLRPDALVFAPNGDLYFGTFSTGAGSRGVWRIPGALQSDRKFQVPQQVLRPTGEVFDAIDPTVFLTTGPFQGDLLIVESPNESTMPRGQVLRAVAPGFTSTKEFILAHKDLETGYPFLPVMAAINSQGDVFVTDFTNNKILRYGPDGAFKGVFAKVVFPNQIAIGPDDRVYVTNVRFGGQGAESGGLFIFNPQGKQIAPATIAPMHVRGVTVCTER